jgi:hypothetical protein
LDSISHFLSGNLAVKAYAAFLHCRQVIEVELPHRFVVKRRVRSFLVVELKVIFQALFCIARAVVGVQINLFVLDALPQPFNVTCPL